MQELKEIETTQNVNEYDLMKQIAYKLIYDFDEKEHIAVTPQNANLFIQYAEMHARGRNLLGYIMRTPTSVFIEEDILDLFEMSYLSNQEKTLVYHEVEKLLPSEPMQQIKLTGNFCRIIFDITHVITDSLIREKVFSRVLTVLVLEYKRKQSNKELSIQSLNNTETTKTVKGFEFTGNQYAGLVIMASRMLLDDSVQDWKIAINKRNIEKIIATVASTTDDISWTESCICRMKPKDIAEIEGLEKTNFSYTTKLNAIVWFYESFPHNSDMDLDRLDQINSYVNWMSSPVLNDPKISDATKDDLTIRINCNF